MDKNKLIQKLNYFYTLELNQVELYTAQSKKVDDLYFSKVFKRAAQIEASHVDNIATLIRDLGANPTNLGDVIGPLLGKIAGHIFPLTGLKNMLEANVLLEQKAIADYKDLISKVGSDQGLVDLLWSHLIDEDLHATWFASQATKLKKLKGDFN